MSKTAGQLVLYTDGGAELVFDYSTHASMEHDYEDIYTKLGNADYRMELKDKGMATGIWMGKICAVRKIYYSLEPRPAPPLPSIPGSIDG